MNLGKSVARITIIRSDESGQSIPTVIYRKKRSRKKGSPGLRTLEKITRNMMNAQSTSSDKYLSRHKRSNRKRRNGWLRDMGTNMARAHSKGMKKLRPSRWF